MAVADFELCKAAEQQEVAIQLRDTISEALCRSSCEAMPCWMLTSTHGPGPTPADASWRHRRASMERDVLGLKDDVATPSSWECTAKLRIQLADETAPTEDEGAGHGFELVWWKKQQGRQPCTVRVKGDGAVEIVLLPRDFGGELAECKGDHDDDGRKQTAGNRQTQELHSSGRGTHAAFAAQGSVPITVASLSRLVVASLTMWSCHTPSTRLCYTCLSGSDRTAFRRNSVAL
jgi:hypothetical protein